MLGRLPSHAARAAPTASHRANESCGETRGNSCSVQAMMQAKAVHSMTNVSAYIGGLVDGGGVTGLADLRTPRRGHACGTLPQVRMHSLHTRGSTPVMT